jgi:DNA-binding transcriptional MocR family regulator
VSAHTHLSGRAATALLPDLGHSRMPRYTALAHGLVELVLDGRIAPGTRLPSERELAASLRVSRATVTAAYDVLRGQHYLASRSGSGSVVVLPPRATIRAGSARWSPAGRSANSSGEVIDLTSATLPAPADELAAAVEAATAELPAVARGDGYEPAGLPVLRAAVAERFTRRGLPTAAEQILITNGALHGIDLVLRLMTGPADRVLTELPTYSGLLDAVRGCGLRLVPVPMSSAGGWNLTAMTAALRHSSPRLAILIPDFHNPTGALVPPEARAEVLRAAHRSGTSVVVDESFVELGLSAVPPAPTAGLDRAVITIGSVSKPFWGGVRTGWIRAGADLIARLAALRARIDMAGPALDQLITTHVVTELDGIAYRRRQQLRPRRDALLTALAEHLPHWRAAVPVGGLSAWVEMDAALATPLATTAPRFGVQVVPGARFGVDGTLERFVRLPFTQPEPALAEAVRRLAQTWHTLDPSAGSYAPLIVA